MWRRRVWRRRWNRTRCTTTHRAHIRDRLSIDQVMAVRCQIRTAREIPVDAEACRESDSVRTGRIWHRRRRRRRRRWWRRIVITRATGDGASFGDQLSKKAMSAVLSQHCASCSYAEQKKPGLVFSSVHTHCSRVRQCWRRRRLWYVGSYRSYLVDVESARIAIIHVPVGTTLSVTLTHLTCHCD